MGTFGGNTKVSRAVTDPGTDHALPSPGGLSWGAITGASAMPGTVGADAELIHGDRWIQVTGDHTETVTSNLNLTVGSNQTLKVGADHKETICGTANETIIGPHVITNLGEYNETRIGAHIQLHGGLEWVHDKENEWHYGGLNCVFYANVHEMEIDHYELALGHFEVKGQHNYFSANDNNAVLFQFQTKALNAEVDLTDADIKALKGDVQALQARLGALEGNAHACVATAGPDPNPTPLI
jgi:hypothetical protein